jgi:hypothetical protein
MLKRLAVLSPETIASVRFGYRKSLDGQNDDNARAMQ